jgi:hypothetical protein
MKLFSNSLFFILGDIKFLISLGVLPEKLNFIKKQIGNLYVLECEKLVS